jgi:hypothetical protein
MTPKKMKQISEAYERIQAIELDITDVQSTAERLLDKTTSVWISMDLEDDLIQEMSTPQWSTTTASGFFFSSSEIKQEIEDNGLSVQVPDTVALEILGVILRYKQQLIQNENNNI